MFALRSTSLLLLSSLLLCACEVPPLQVTSQPRKEIKNAPGQLPRIPAADPAAAEVPQGYKVEAVVTDLVYPSCAEQDPAGNLYVAEAGYVYGDRAAPARVWQIAKNGDMRIVADQLNGPITGLLWYENQLYITHKGKVSILESTGNVRDIVTDLPSLGDHFNNELAVGPDGKLYFGQGTATNSGVVGVDNFVFGWLGEHPDFHDRPAHDIKVTGPEFVTLDPIILTAKEPALVRTGPFNAFGQGAVKGGVVKGQTKANGTILRMNPDGSNLEVFAWGLRNPYGIAWTQQGRLFAADNGYDDRGSRPVANAPDVIWEIAQNGWYGWPDYVAGEPITDAKFQAPKKNALKFILQDHPPVQQPFIKLPVEAAVTQLDISRSDKFGFEGQLFVGEVGDMSPVVGPRHPVGYQVARIDPLTRKAETFFHTRQDALGPAENHLEYVQTAGPKRIVGVRFSPNGDALYVADIGAIAIFPSPTPAIQAFPGTGVIWRITKEGTPVSGPPAGLSILKGRGQQPTVRQASAH